MNLSARFSRDNESRATQGDDSQRRWFKRPKVVLSALAVLAVVVIFGAWLMLSAQEAKSSLERARASAQQAKDALLQGDTAGASQFASEAQASAAAARAATHSLPWNIAAVVPWLGSPFKSGQQISDVVLGLSASVLKPTADAGTAIAPDQLLANGQLDVTALRRQEAALTKIAADAADLNSSAQAIADPHYISALKSARSQLQAQTSEIAKLMGNAALAARLAPPLMGADGPRTYFMGFQTNAEARGTGGLLGGFGVLRFDNGKPSVENLGPNTTLFKPFAPISLGPEFDEQYGFMNPTTDIRNSNLSAHFPFAAQIWKSMWQQQSGMTVDGAIAIDPIALSYILGATGPVVMPDGETVTKDNVVELTESTLYIRFPTDQAARKQYLQDIGTEVVRKITKRVDSPRKLLEALGRAISERRIAVWTSAPVEQQLLEQTALAHIIADDPSPYAQVVVNNLAGNKLDYYLNRRIEYVADGCEADARRSTVTVRLTNTVTNPDALPDYVAGRMGFFPEAQGGIPKGTMISSVRLLATKGAQLGSVLANGKRVRVWQRVELGHPSFEAQVAIPAGQSIELTFRLSEPTVPGDPKVPIQPLIDNISPVISVPKC